MLGGVAYIDLCMIFVHIYIDEQTFVCDGGVAETRSCYIDASLHNICLEM